MSCSESCPPCQNTNRSCHHINGQCLCSPGYTGIHCGEICPHGYYGPNCKNQCKCHLKGSECNHITGQCNCFPGWKGETCSDQCPSGKFGMNCNQDCHCLNGGNCRATDGKCSCQPGFMGSRCSEICSEGFYGDDCLQPCKCLNDNYVCDPANGCVCKYGMKMINFFKNLIVILSGFTGTNCDERLMSPRGIIPEESNSNGGLIVGICISIIFLSIALALVFYYRKRLERMKHELAYVTYTTEIQPDQRHFDNPVYCSTNNVKNIIQNNLSLTKNNIEKAKLGCSTDRMADFGACGESSNLYSEIDEKPKRDYNYNPNIYNSIEDLKQFNDKKEPFYDELKRKSAECKYYNFNIILYHVNFELCLN